MKRSGSHKAYPPKSCGHESVRRHQNRDIALLIAIFLIYAYAGTFNYNELAQSSLAEETGG